ncbi:MAG: transcription termination/antitermination protein NusG [Cyanobacteria bacterium J06648_16]
MTYAADDNETNYDELGQADVENADETKKVKARWYAVQVASGCEKRVKLNLEQRIQTLDVANRVLAIEIPQTPAVKMRKDGTRQNIEEKVFPGYVLIRMALDDDVWQVVKNTPHVINFVGAEQRRATGRGRGHVKPMPLSHSEVKRIFAQTQEQAPVVKVDLADGDKILVLSGPFKDFSGEVIEVSPERSKLKALLSIFGRDTPVELEFNQVQKEG